MSEIDLDDGLTPVRLGQQTFGVDLVGWTRWYAAVGEQYASKPFELTEAVRAKLKAEAGAEVNHSQADAFLHALMLRYDGLKKKQSAERKSLTSTDSTPSG